MELTKIYSDLKKEYDGKLFSDNFLKIHITMKDDQIICWFDIDKNDYDGDDEDYEDKCNSATLFYDEVVKFLVDRFGEEFKYDDPRLSDEYIDRSNRHGKFEIVLDDDGEEPPVIAIWENEESTTKDESLIEDAGVGMRYNEGMRREVMPMNGRKSFGHKAIEEEDGDGFTLFSYETPVARLERRDDGSGLDFTLLNDYLSTTTLTHIHSWLLEHNQRDIPTKKLLEMNVGDSVPMMAAESKKVVKEGGKRYPAANGCTIHDCGDCFVVTNKNGTTIGQCRSMIEAETIAEQAKGDERRMFNEGAGAGYTVRIKDLKFGNIIDKKLIKGKKRYDDYYECKVEILPGEYEIEAEDYYNDFFWQEHEFGDTPTAKIDGGVATIAYSTNSYDEDEADDELRSEISHTEMDISFDYGWGWVHVDLPKDKPIESDHVDVEGREFYGSIDKIELNAPDLADAVNCGHQSIYDRDSEDDEDNGEEYDESIDSGSSEWRVFDYGEDFPYTERYTVLDPDGYQFFISHNGGVGSFTEDPLEGTSEEICDELEVEIEDKMWKPVELSKREMLDNITVMKGLRRIKEKYDYDDQD